MATLWLWRRAVVASHAPMHSGSRTWSACFMNCIQVACCTSAASAALSPILWATRSTMEPNRLNSSLHARSSPLAALRMTSPFDSRLKSTRCLGPTGRQVSANAISSAIVASSMIVPAISERSV